MHDKEFETWKAAEVEIEGLEKNGLKSIEREGVGEM